MPALIGSGSCPHQSGRQALPHCSAGDRIDEHIAPIAGRVAQANVIEIDACSNRGFMHLHLVADAMRAGTMLTMTKAVFNCDHAPLYAMSQHHGRLGAASGSFEIDLVTAAQAQSGRILRM